MTRGWPRPERWLAFVVGLPAGVLAAINFKAAIGLVAAAVVGLLVLVGAEYLLLGVVAVEPWTDALNFPTPTLSIPKIVGFLTVVSYAMMVATGRLQVRFTPQMGWAFAFLAVIFVGLVLAPDPGQSITTTISYTLYILFLGLFVQSIRSSADADRCLAVYTASIALGTLFGLGTFIAGTAHLASGPIADPNDYASTLAGGLPLALYFSVHSARWRWLWRTGAVLIVVTMLATLSRGALVGFAAVVIWALLSGRISLPGIIAMVLAVLIGVGVGFTFFKPLVDEHIQEKSAYANINVDSREAFWSAAIKMAENHPLFGVGPGRFPDEVGNYVLNDPIALSNPYTHESYLEILAEDGIFAIGLYLAFLGSSWGAMFRLRRLAREAGDRRGVDRADALMAGFLWTCVTMLFITRMLAIPLWLFSGIAGSLLLARQQDLLGGAPSPDDPHSQPSTERRPLRAAGAHA
jgi:putative inorganic carbon (HCO3(-)) transporter